MRACRRGSWRSGARFLSYVALGRSGGWLSGGSVGGALSTRRLSSYQRRSPLAFLVPRGAVFRATPSLVQRNMQRLFSPDALDSFRLNLSTSDSHVDSGHQLSLLTTEVGMRTGFLLAHHLPPPPLMRGDDERRLAEKLRASGASVHRRARGAA